MNSYKRNPRHKEFSDAGNQAANGQDNEQQNEQDAKNSDEEDRKEEGGS
tara:strand:- start:390 stop:536 length:147 start_codon:yes stop_codon:yes gene_type:complete